MKVRAPEGVKGNWAIETYTVNRMEYLHTVMRAIAANQSWHIVPEGKYTRLVCRTEERAITVMSDTPSEIASNQEFITRARGRVLINGLGLGIVLDAILNKPEVEHVTVVEQELDVISLVWPAFAQESRTSLVHADALTWTPPDGEFYDVVWHDIWPGIDEDNIPEMDILEARYKDRCAWQRSWARERCEELKSVGDALASLMQSTG